MTTRLGQLTRSAAALVGLCGIAAAGVTASCFSERTTVAPPTTCQDPCVVEIRSFSFQPAQVRITAGTTVRWVNRDQVQHTSTSDGAGWDSPLLAQDASFSRTFTTAGEFPYHCEPHPNMRGTVIVE
jgi:plastocyanin